MLGSNYLVVGEGVGASPSTRRGPDRSRGVRPDRPAVLYAAGGRRSAGGCLGPLTRQPACRNRSRPPNRKSTPTVGSPERPQETVAAGLLLPPAGLVGLLVMHAVKRPMDNTDGRPGRVNSSDLSWLAAAQARAWRPRRPADKHTSAG